MAGLIKQFVGRAYPFGDYKLAPEATSGILVGGFVTADHTEGEFDVPADDATGTIYMVVNENDPLVPHNQDYREFTVNAGDFVKAKPMIDGEVVQTTLIGSTYAGISEGDELGVGADGKLYLIADLTAVDFTTFATTFKVVKNGKAKLWQLDSLILEVNTKTKTA